MKNLYRVAIGLLCSTSVIAQPVIMGNRANIKLSDVIRAHNEQDNDVMGFKPTEKDNASSGSLQKILKGEKEHDYRFNHWLWYWQRHTNKDGYLVGPAADWRALQSLQSTSNDRNADRTTSTTLTWTFQGPDSSGAFTGDGAGSGVGRINVIAFHPTDSNTYMIGSPGGGAWRTNNDGHTWTCVTDQLPNLSVGDIRYNPLNPNTVYLASGDRDGGDYPGIGVLKSYDGGTTWTTTGMSWPDSLYNTANCILVNPIDTNSLILATSLGIYRSFNAGASWVLVSAGDFTQVLYRPGDTSIVYGGTTNMSASAEIYRSTNGGWTWTTVPTTFSGVMRVSLAVTPANPNLVMALASTNSGSNYAGLDGIYKSTDSGVSFTEVYTGSCTGNHDLLGWNSDASDCGGQGWYDLPIAISPTNANYVYIGGVNAWRSTNGGTSWQILNQWAPSAPGVVTVHADKHWMAFNPLSPSRFFETNDGGVYSAYNPSSSGTWRNLTNGIGITEFYGVGVSGVDNFVIAGAQDVGTKLIRPGLYEEGDGGDGMWSQLDFVDSTVGYASSEYGYIDNINPTAFQPDLTANDISGNISGGSVEGTGSWVTPFMVEPLSHTCLVAGYTQVYKTCDEGNSWASISTAFSSNTLSHIALTPADSNTIFVSEDALSAPIHYTHSSGTSWTTLTPPYASAYVSGIAVDPRDAGNIWVSFGGYGANHISSWSSALGWQPFDTGIPDVPVNCITMNKLTREMYAGTEIGVFYRDSTMSSWVPQFTGMPVVSVTDLEIDYFAGEIWASTYGRSLWHAMIPALVPTIAPSMPDNIKVYPNPNGGSFNVTLGNIDNQLVSLCLVDVLGRTVWAQENIANSGKVLPINTVGLVPGNYVLEVFTGDHVIAGRQTLVITK